VIETLVALTVAGLALLAERLIRRVVAAVARRWAKRAPRKRVAKIRRRWKRPTKPPTAGGRRMAYALLIGGTAATVAANYAHAEENIGAKLLSAVIPVLLFIAFHAAANDGRWWIRVTTGVVALLCFAISFDHIMHLAQSYGESTLSAVLYPLAIDGAMIVGTFILSRAADWSDRTSVGASAVLSEDKPAPSPVRKPVRPAAPKPAPVLSSVRTEDKPRTNGAVRPLPHRTEDRTVSAPKDNAARHAAAVEIAKELGDRLSRTTLVEALKNGGYKISTNEAAKLARELKAARS